MKIKVKYIAQIIGVEPDGFIKCRLLDKEGIRLTKRVWKLPLKCKHICKGYSLLKYPEHAYVEEIKEVWRTPNMYQVCQHLEVRNGTDLKVEPLKYMYIEEEE